MKCFTSLGMRSASCRPKAEAFEFPHSEISGSKVARHLTEAYRSYAPSFIAILCQGIHHMLLNFLLGNLKTTFCLLLNFVVIRQHVANNLPVPALIR
jgi:hypothetical protein